MKSSIKIWDRQINRDKAVLVETCYAFWLQNAWWMLSHPKSAIGDEFMGKDFIVHHTTAPTAVTDPETICSWNAVFICRENSDGIIELPVISNKAGSIGAYTRDKLKEFVKDRIMSESDELKEARRKTKPGHIYILTGKATGPQGHGEPGAPYITLANDGNGYELGSPYPACTTIEQARTLRDSIDTYNDYNITELPLVPVIKE